MDRLEEAILSGALTQPATNEPDPDGREPVRWPSDDDTAASDDASAHRAATDVMPAAYDAPMYRSKSSQGPTRGWSGNTGPKGVLQDFKASHGKSGAILGGGLIDFGGHSIEHRLDRLILRPGAPPVASKSPNPRPSVSLAQPAGNASDESEGEKEVKEARRRERIAEMQRQTGGRASPGVKTDSRGRRLFGYLREVGLENFVQAIDAEKDDRECAVVIHLYDPALQSCHILNTHLAHIARHNPTTKFLRGIATDLDFFTNASAPHMFPTLTPSPSEKCFSFASFESGADPFRDGSRSEASEGTIRSSITVGQDPFADGRRRATDQDVLPTIVIYRGGEQVGSIIAVERELPDGELKLGEEGCRAVERLLAELGLISKTASLSNPQGRVVEYQNRSRSQSPDSF